MAKQNNGNPPSTTNGLFQVGADGNIKVNDQSRLDKLASEANNTILTRSDQRIDGSFKPQLDHIEKFTGTSWDPTEGADAFKDKLAKANYYQAKKQAEDQHFFGEAAGFLGQAVGGEIVLGTLEGIGYLLDIPGWYSRLKGDESNFGNWFSDLMASGKEGIANALPIYQDPDNANRSIWANMLHGDGWWAQNGVSVASTLSLLIPTTGAVRALGLAGRALNVANTAGKVGKLGKIGKVSTTPISLVKSLGKSLRLDGKIGESLLSATISRHLENSLEASQVFKETKDRYMQEEGMSEEEAEKYAGKAAAFTYNAGWAMMIQDFPQYLLASRGFNISKAITGAKLAKATGSSIGKAVTMKVGRNAFNFLSEGTEEAYQFIVAEEGKHLADVQAGLADPDDSQLSDRLKKYYNDSELWTSAFFGGFGGSIFNVAHNVVKTGINGKLLSRLSGVTEEEEARLNEILTWKQRNSAAIRDYYEALETDNEAAYEMALRKMHFNTGAQAASMGNWAIRKQELLDLKNVDNSKLQEQFDLTEEQAQDFKENIDTHIINSEKAAETFGKYASKYDVNTAYTMAYYDNMVSSINEKVPTINKEIDTLKQQIPHVNNMSAVGKSTFEKLIAIKALERVINSNDIIKKKLDNISKTDIDYINSENVNYTDKIKELKTELNSYLGEYKKDLTQNDNLAISYLTSGLADDIISKESEKIYIDFYSKKWNGELSDLINDIKGEKTQEKIKKVAEKLGKRQKQEENIALQNNSKDEAINKPKLKETFSKDELEVSSQDDYIEEQFDSPEQFFKILDDQIKTKQVDVTDLDAETFKNYNEWKTRITKSETFSKVEENIVSSKTIKETPNNPETEEEWDKGTDAEKLVTQIETPLGWLSANNDRADENSLREENIALSSFLENNESLEGTYVVFSVDTEYLKSGELEDKKHYSSIRKAVSSGHNLSVEQLGVLPIKATIYRDGEPVIYNGSSLNMYLHTAQFFEGSDSQVFQTEKLLEHKRLIYEAFKKGKQLQSDIEYKTNGKLRLDDLTEDGFKKNSFSKVLGKSYENISLVYGNEAGDYLNANKKLSDTLINLMSSSKGAIYAISETPNGNPFPLRLLTDKISQSEAALIYTLYSSLLNQPGLLKQSIMVKLSPDIQSLGEMIRSNTDPRIAGLDTYLDLNSITYQALLDHLVYQGQNTAHKNESALYIVKAEKREDNTTTIPASVVFGNNRLTGRELLDPANKELFIDHLVKNRNRQVDIDYLNNPKYKQYMDLNGILSTNIKPSTQTTSLFVQPVVKYKDELKEVNTSLFSSLAKTFNEDKIGGNKKEDETKSNIDEETKDTGVSTLDEEMNNDLLKILESKKNTESTNDSALDFLDGLPDIDDSPGLFKSFKSVNGQLTYNIVNKIKNDPNTKLVDLDSLIKDLVSKNKIRTQNPIITKTAVRFFKKLGISDYTNEFNLSDKELKNYYLNILDKIAPFIKDTKIYSYKDSKLGLITGSTNFAGFALYDQNEIYLGSTLGLNLNSLVHELMHSVTQNALLERSNLYDGEFHSNIKELLKIARENIKEEHYGLTNEHELIAEAFSNPRFQVALSKVKTDGVDKSSNIFLDIINEISKLFRRVFKLNVKSTLLNDIFNIVGNKLDNTDSISTDQQNNKTEQNEEFNFIKYGISAKEWLSLSEEERDKIKKCN